MVRVIKTDRTIMAVGHAKTKEVCGMFSGVCTAIGGGLDAAGDGDAYDLSFGFFTIDIGSVGSEYGIFLCSLFLNCMKQLCEDYPDSFKINYI